MEQLTFLDRPPSADTPLSYFGAKPAHFFRILSTYLPNDLKELASPFTGGSRIELMLAATGVNVYGSDYVKELVQFYKSFQEDASAVCHKASELCPLSKEDIIHYRETHFEGLSDIETAAIYWLMTKQSFMGLVLSQKTNYGQKYTNRLEPKSFVKEKWLNWQNKYFHIEHLDCFDAVKKHKNKFMYLDPPYVGKEKCYGWYDNDEILDHEKLAQALKEHNAPWILSYGDHELIRELYKDYEILVPEWFYYTTNKKSEELLILNL